MTFYAHSRPRQDDRPWQELRIHLNAVAAKASEFAPEAWKPHAYMAGLLHDAGKYQRALQGNIATKPESSDEGTDSPTRSRIQNAVEGVSKWRVLGEVHSDGSFTKSGPRRSKCYFIMSARKEHGAHLPYFSRNRRPSSNLGSSGFGSFIHDVPSSDVLGCSRYPGLRCAVEDRLSRAAIGGNMCADPDYQVCDKLRRTAPPSEELCRGNRIPALLDDPD